MMAGVDIQHVPYRGAAPAMTDLLAGQVQSYFSTTPSCIEHIRAGRVRGLAVTTANRLDAFPDLPAIGEFIKGYEATAWYGVGAPRETPRPIVERLNREINAVLAEPRMKARLDDLGCVLIRRLPDEFGKLIAEEPKSGARSSSLPTSGPTDREGVGAMPIDKRTASACRGPGRCLGRRHRLDIGFRRRGFPNFLIRALRDRGPKDLTLVVNSATHRYSYTHELIEAGLVRKVVVHGRQRSQQGAVRVRAIVDGRQDRARVRAARHLHRAHPRRRRRHSGVLYAGRFRQPSSPREKRCGDSRTVTTCWSTP
jgi:hypothetical protein